MCRLNLESDLSPIKKNKLGFQSALFSNCAREKKEQQRSWLVCPHCWHLLKTLFTQTHTHTLDSESGSGHLKPSYSRQEVYIHQPKCSEASLHWVGFKCKLSPVPSEAANVQVIDREREDSVAKQCEECNKIQNPKLS